MIGKRLLVAGGLCLLLSGMRDPFQPPLDTCQIAQLSHWQFHGIIQGAQTFGILRDADGVWHRVTAGEILPAGWRVVSMTMNELLAATGKDCSPAQWRWKREGTKNEKMDSEHPVLHPALPLYSGDASHHADGG